ncbi:hypothetical protein PTKIN_Ptkin18bG0113900 [Pterospermum kingtungense]
MNYHIYLQVAFLPSIPDTGPIRRWPSYKSIISFGDSLADTGNLVTLIQPKLPPSALPPYGQTGRFSDGRLVIDFIAENFGLPFVPPYFGAARNEHLKSSLILTGEIGGNDFNHAFIQGIRPDVVRRLVPDVINVISSAILELIKFGGVTVLVPGNFPIGCLPIHLTRFQTSNEQDYDSSGCLTWLNEFSESYNGMLIEELNRIQRLHPSANIVYADYYQAAIPFLRSPRQSETAYCLISKADLDGLRTIRRLEIPCS